MEDKNRLDLLAQRGIHPTAIRLLVLEAMQKINRPVSLSELETILDTVDKSAFSGR